jgi:hypothetical protein
LTNFRKSEAESLAFIKAPARPHEQLNRCVRSAKKKKKKKEKKSVSWGISIIALLFPLSLWRYLVKILLSS